MLKAGDDLAAAIVQSVALQSGDIIVVSSKVAATVEGAAVELAKIRVSPEAEELYRAFGKTPQHRQFVLDETARMNGTVIRTMNGVVLTELKPDGIAEGTLIVPNAGIDESNIERGWAVGWPRDPVESVRRLRRELMKKVDSVAIILSDSGLSPRRSGVTAFALTVAGMDPLYDRRGKPDLYGRDMVMTVEAIADQLATAANSVMGNADERTPAAVIRDHGLPMTEFTGWVPGIEREKDVYFGVV